MSKLKDSTQDFPGGQWIKNLPANVRVKGSSPSLGFIKESKEHCKLIC